MQTVMETVNGRIPVVVGTSHSEKRICIELSKEAFSAGAAGVMIAPPSLKDYIDDDIIKLYSDIGDAIGDGAIVVQDFPR